MHKWLSGFLMLALALCLLTGCSQGGDGTDYNALYDDQEKLASETSSYQMQEKHQQLEDYSTALSLRMEGMLTIWTFDAEADQTLDASYQLVMQQGKAKLVFIDGQGNLTLMGEAQVGEAMDRPQTLTLPVTAGTNRVKLVAADDARLTLSLQIPEAGFTDLGQ